MSTGIWTGVANSTKLTTFGSPLLSTFADKVRSLVVTAGPHVRFVNMGCLPLFVVPTPVPTTDADALARGIPVGTEPSIVLALAAGTYTLYSPYESLSLLSSEGTLT
ncbi:MAG: hypothetical protein [Bacteriophage sp.]|nr:MAG: hypothetical protein [Bacteriophage sp.]